MSNIPGHEDSQAAYKEALDKVDVANRFVSHIAVAALLGLGLLNTIALVVFAISFVSDHHEVVQRDKQIECSTSSLNFITTELADAQAAEVNHTVYHFTYPKPC